MTSKTRTITVPVMNDDVQAIKEALLISQVGHGREGFPAAYLESEGIRRTVVVNLLSIAEDVALNVVRLRQAAEGLRRDVTPTVAEEMWWTVEPLAQRSLVRRHDEAVYSLQALRSRLRPAVQLYQELVEQDYIEAQGADRG
jgi:hypothetical protein